MAIVVSQAMSFVQVLPFASEETLSQLEQNISACGSVTDMLHEGASPQDITARLLQGLGVASDGFSLLPRCPPAALDCP